MSAAPKMPIMEYIVLGVSIANLRQVPLKKFLSREEAESFIKNFKDHKSAWEKIEETSLFILVKEKPQHIPEPEPENETYETGNPLLPRRKKSDHTDF